MHHSMVRRISRSLILAIAGLVLAGPADAAQRYASVGASPSETTCTALAPCTPDVAINNATVADEVIIRPGTYTVLNPLTLTKAIPVHGEAGSPRPVLQATLATATLTVSAAGATVSHLEVRSNGNQKPAISVEAGATLDRVVGISATGVGIDALSDTTPTVIRNSVAVTHVNAPGQAGLRVSDGPNDGGVEVRNVTAWADGTDSTAFRCRTTTATTTIVNTIARGVTYDVDAGIFSGKTPLCPATASNARAGKSPLFSPSSSVEPTFENVAADDYRPKAGSSTIDAGADAAQNGTLDLAGAARRQGLATDVGAFEFVPASPPPPAPGNTTTTPETPTPDTTTTTTPAQETTPVEPRATPTVPPVDEPAPAGLPDAAPPQLGASMLLDTGKGTVLVKLPGTNGYVPLSDAANLPFGTTIDARKGEVTLSTALPGGKEQTGSFTGGQFEVRQSKRDRGVTDIRLRGAFTTECPGRKSARAAAKKRKKTVRRLWGRDKGGRFRTHGRDSVATVRGTRWLTEDRCDGTFTKVTEGAVDVRAKRTGKVKRVKAGRSVLIRHQPPGQHSSTASR